MVREIGYAYVALYAFGGFCIMFLLCVDKEWNLFTGNIYINRVRMLVCAVVMVLVILNFWDAIVSLSGKFILHG